MLAEAGVLEALQERERATLRIGELHHSRGHVQALLQPHRFNRHTFLCGQSGSGKTYALGCSWSSSSSTPTCRWSSWTRTRTSCASASCSPRRHPTTPHGCADSTCACCATTASTTRSPRA
ncbi:hypothetical protein NKG05_19185 [Oerskovia sp. M15]